METNGPIKHALFLLKIFFFGNFIRTFISIIRCFYFKYYRNNPNNHLIIFLAHCNKMNNIKKIILFKKQTFSL